MFRSSVVVMVAAAGALLPALPALAQAQLRARLDKGQEIRQTLVLDQHFVTTFVPPDKPPTERLNRFEIATTFRVLDTTPAGARVEMRFDSIKGDITPVNGEAYQFDSTTPPKSSASKDALTFHETSKRLVATPQTFLVKPDGTIDEFKPNEELMKLGGARLFRRVLEADGVKHTFGPIFALRTDGQTVKVGDQWQQPVILLADRGRQEAPELRRLSKLEGSAATVSTEIRATGQPGATVNVGSIYLRDVTGRGTHTWDAAGQGFVSNTVEDSITFVMMLPNDSKNELTTITKTTLTPRTGAAAPASDGTAAPAPKN